MLYEVITKKEDTTILMNNFIADFFKWALELVYSFVGSYGWAIIIVTVLMRIVVLPLDIQQRKGMRSYNFV